MNVTVSGCKGKGRSLNMRRTQMDSRGPQHERAGPEPATCLGADFASVDRDSLERGHRSISSCDQQHVRRVLRQQGGPDQTQHVVPAAHGAVASGLHSDDD